MHKHHATLRLLIHLLAIFLVGLAIYLLLIYGLSRHATPSNTATSSPITATSSASMATSSPIVTSTKPSPTASTTLSTNGMQIVTESDNNTTVYLKKGQRFEIQLGTGLNWTFVFNPVGILSYVQGTSSSTSQGIYQADAVGTTTLGATGAPICKPNQACPMFLAVSRITFVVK